MTTSNRPLHNVSNEGGDGNPTTSSIRSNHSSKGHTNVSCLSDLISVVSEMATAIKYPVHWMEILYERAMEVDGFNEQ